MGDPAGIGPDITLQAWCERKAAGLPAFIVLGDPEVFSKRAQDLGLKVPIEEMSASDTACESFGRALPVYPLHLPKPVMSGKPDVTSAAIIIEAIDIGVEWVRQGKAAALVTNPINKKLLSEAGFVHPGHTEYLAELCSENNKAPRPVMLLTSGDLRVVPVTVHIPLKDVPAALNEELIIETVNITVSSLRDSFHIPAPRIGITGLNPHAGEDGTLGHEEIETIIPAIEQLKAQGLDVSGPLPADAVFQERLRGTYDVIIAMYHDQALIPVKTLAFDRTVNVTLGLPIVRTSPDHGTAYALAGTGKASAGSLIESLRLAENLSLHELATT
jgi:4-hydroxythreonine-4-phosphate dehydrogenase